MNSGQGDIVPQRLIVDVVELLNQNRLIEAHDMLSPVMATWPRFAPACYLLGVIRQRQGRMDEATQLYMQALSILPGYNPARQQLIYLNKLRLEIKEWEPAPGAIYCYWFNSVSNWGDALNKVLIEKLSGKRVLWSAPGDYRVREKYIVIGSILKCADANTVVWGSGATSEQMSLTMPPKRICAVRGPKTRQLVVAAGQECPDVYGDPALLLPRFYDKPVEQTHDIGIIAHYVDQQHPWLRYAEEQGASIINILGNIHRVVDEVRACKLIASSSLHGMILADAYGIPSAWLEFSKNVAGGGFKFRDYFASVGRSEIDPLKIDSATRLSDVYASFTHYTIDIDLDRLYHACPFLK